MQKAIIIVAGGSGNRMKSDIPKQFLLLKNKPVLMHTIEAFYSFDNSIEIVLVLPESQINYWKDLCKKYSFNIEYKIALGGDTRFLSVKNGLNKISTGELIGVHDGVRPLVSVETLQKCYSTCAETGSAVPVIDAFESIREIDNGGSKAVNRDKFKLVQTPQVFTQKIILEAYHQDFAPDFTDDASVVERAGYSISLVKGNRENIKITTPIDLKIGEALMQ